TLIDQNNNEFRTSNSNLIERLVNRLSALFTEKIDEFSDEIIDFEFLDLVIKKQKKNPLVKLAKGFFVFTI
ncbi:MAG: hypothetical protein KDC92_17400, partial [Bacteroidetes bacterium]|nr:hypothetical protein [Bacteroidota bacterium]